MGEAALPEKKMAPKKVLVVYKESAYSRFLLGGKAPKRLRRHPYWTVVKGSHERHHNTLKMVKEILQSEGFAVDAVLRSRVSRMGKADKKYSLVVSVGGDGTLLDSSHQIDKIPILGVNSDPVRSVARFSACRAETFQEALRAYLRGKLKPVSVPRLEFSINGRPRPWVVLNDLLVAAASPAGTSRYLLRRGTRAEEQMSSGIWISTAAGSTAAILSAGGTKLPVYARRFQFVVREAYHKKFGPRRLLKGVLAKGEILEVTSHMKEGKVFIDGASHWEPFQLGQKLRVRLSKRPLRIIGLKH